MKFAIQKYGKFQTYDILYRKPHTRDPGLDDKRASVMILKFVIRKYEKFQNYGILHRSPHTRHPALGDKRAMFALHASAGSKF